MYEDLCIITPTLNEKENIRKFISLCKIWYPDVKIIVADDGSTDGTRGMVLDYKDQNVFLIDRSDKKIHGLTVSVLDAIDLCDKPYFVVMDVDLQHPIEKVKFFYDRLKEGAEVVVGNRIDIIGDWPLSRRIVSKIATLLGRMKLKYKRGISVNDPMSGFFAMKTDLAKEIMSSRYLKFELEGYKVLFDFLKYMLKNIEIKEVDYVFRIRGRGESKATMKVGLSYLKSLFR